MSTDVEVRRMVARLVGDTTSFTQSMKQAQSVATKTAANITTKLRSITKKTAQLLDNFSQKLQVMGQSLSMLGSSLSLLSAGIVGFGALAVKAGSDFEEGFAGVQKTVEASQEELIALRQGFKDLAEETPIAVEELLRIGELAGQLGISNNRILSFTDSIAKIGITTNLTTEEAALSFAQFSNVVGLPQEKISNLASSVVDLGNNFATTENDIVQMMNRLSENAVLAGLNSQEIVGLSAALTSVGVQAEMGGTAITRLFKDVTTAVASGGKELEEFANVAGTSTEEFQQTFRESAVDGLGLLLRGLNKLDKESRVLALEKMGFDGARLSSVFVKMAGAIDKVDGAISTANKAFKESTALNKEAEVRFKTFGSALILVKNNLKLLGDEVFQAVKPALKSLISQIRTVISWFRDLSPEAKKAIVVFAGMLALIGPVVAVMGLAVIALGSMVGALSTLASVFSLVLSPVGLFIAGVTALGVAISGLLLAISGLSFEEVFESGKETFNNLLNNVKGFISNFEANMKILFDWLKGQWKIISENISSVWEKIGEVGTFITGITKQNVRDMFSSFWDFTKGVIGFVINIKENFTILTVFLMGNFENFFRDFSRLNQTFLSNMQSNFRQALISVATLTIEVFSQIGDVLLEAIKGNIDIGDVGKTLFTRLSRSFKQEFKKFKSPLQGFESSIGNLPKFNLSVDGLNLPDFLFDQAEKSKKEVKKALGESGEGSVLDLFGGTIDQALGVLKNVKPKVEAELKLTTIDAVDVGGAEAATRIREFRLNQSTQQKSKEATLLETTNSILGEILVLQKDGGGLDLTPANIEST